MAWIRKYPFVLLLFVAAAWFCMCYSLWRDFHKDWQRRYDACIADGQKPYVCEALAANNRSVLP